jgi:hypothetical protein
MTRPLLRLLPVARPGAGAFLCAAILLAPGAAALAQAPGTFALLNPATSGVDVFIDGTGREDWGYGTSFFDVDGDGDLDLYVANQNGAPDWLFLQAPDHTFTNAAASAGCDDLGNGRAVKSADFDNDGDQDFFLGNFGGPNRLYRNNGNGTFTDVADAVMASATLTFGGAWGDYNRDGWVDLYVVNRGERNQFFVNNGDGSFTERAVELGIDNWNTTTGRALLGLESVWFDYDNDGDVDLYLSNDKQGGNRLYRNNDDGTFTDVSVASRSNVILDSMGVGLGDYDGNGYVDIYLTNTVGLLSIKNVLLRNNGDGTFDNVATALGVHVAQFGWGCAFLDFDNDMDLDLYVVNWDLQPGNIAAKNVFFRNNGNATFTNVTDQLGVGDTGPGYGLAIADYNDDGFLDMFVTNNGAPSVFYRNVPTGNRWLKVKTIGIQSNRDGIGARVKVTAGSVTQFSDVSGGQSYLCQPSREVEFGLGGFNTASRVEIHWPSGIVDRYDDVAANQTLVAIEGAAEALIVTLSAAVVVDGGVRVAWTASREAGLEGFRVYRRVDGGAKTVVSGESLLAPDATEFIDDSVVPGTAYAYSVAGVESSGETESNEINVTTPAPATAYTLQNHPNPFNPRTTISFDLPGDSPVKLSIFDSGGRLVRVLVDDTRPAGPNEAVWTGDLDAGAVAASGVYYCRIETRFGELTRKMVLLK